MKNLLTYAPEPFDNLEIESFEHAPLVGEMDDEEGFLGGKKIRRKGVGRAKARPPRIASAMNKPGRIPRLPQIPRRQPMRPLLPPRIGAAASLNVFPPADDRRSSGQSSFSGNAGGEGSFGNGNAPAQDVASEHVRWVQETLNRALGLRLVVDGIMNRETRSAVRMFQERKGLPATGLVGPDTEEALRSEGTQAPELLEGEWEMPGSGKCSCNRREMEELVFEAEPFGWAELEELEASSTARLKFEEAAARNDWREAFLHLNGLSMHEMLHALDELSPIRRDNLKSKRQSFRALVNLPRIDFALYVVENRALPTFAPWKLPDDQIQTAKDFLEQPFHIPPENLGPRELAIKDKPLALCWLTQGHVAATHLYDLLKGAPGASVASKTHLFSRALNVHFKLPNVVSLAMQPFSSEKSRVLQRVKIIRDTYQLVLTLFPNDNRLRDSSQGTDPAFAQYNGAIFFTEHFKKYARTARAAMIVHEYVHVVDPQSGHRQNHVSEWDERYDMMTADQSIHNPSSYSAFGQHVCYGEDTRFGAGRPDVEFPPSPSCCP